MAAMRLRTQTVIHDLPCRGARAGLAGRRGFADNAGADGPCSATTEPLMSTADADAFLTAFRGSFTSTLRWPQLDALWERVRAAPDGWFVYAVGEALPAAPASCDELLRFIDEVDALLRREHDEDYCGIVYADVPAAPRMIKIYDPGNLGVSCGYSDNPPLPGWVLSRLRPVDLAAVRPPAGRRRWWQRLFG
jgi:hypothetical protein